MHQREREGISPNAAVAPGLPPPPRAPHPHTSVLQVMPVEVVGFHLKPFGFFDANPGVDIPSGPNAGSKLAGEGCCCAPNAATNGIH